jgi:hypothetical protein
MERRFELGKGILKQSNRGFYVVGEIPFNQNTEVYLIKEKDFERVLNNQLHLLRNSRTELSKEFISQFPDKIELNYASSHKDLLDSVSNLYLDRHFYSHNSRNYILIRYASMSEFEREGDFAHRIDKVENDPIEDIIVERENLRQRKKQLENETKELSKKWNLSDERPPATFSEDEEWYFDGEEWYKIDEENDDEERE